VKPEANVADREDYAAAKLGREAIAERRKVKGSQLDLRDSDLQRIFMTGADLTYADLTGANMKKVHARRASFAAAVMVNASLDEADLVGADLTGANLTGATLTFSRLHGAILTDANLQGTILDPELWMPTILQFWQEATEAIRRLLIASLQINRMLGAGINGTSWRCPVGYRVSNELDGDPFVVAFDTHGITPQQVLDQLWLRAGADMRALGHESCPQVEVSETS